MGDCYSFVLVWCSGVLEIESSVVQSEHELDGVRDHLEHQLMNAVALRQMNAVALGS